MESIATLEGFLIAHGSVLLLPLSVIEGPFVSIVAGILSANGLLDWYWAVAALICGDLIGDALFWWIGRSGGAKLAWIGRHFAVSGELAATIAERLRRDTAKILFVGKWTHSIGALVLIAAGMARVGLARFMLINLAATVPKSFVLFGVGYFVPAWCHLLTRHLPVGLLVLPGLGAVIVFVLLRRPFADFAGGTRP